MRLVALSGVVTCGAAHAAERRDESERWVPSFGLYFDVMRQKVEGSVTTGPVLGPPLTDGGCLERDGSRTGQLCPSERKDPAKIHADIDGTDTAVTPLVGGSLELMTPSLLDGFLRPRLFARGDIAAAFSFERNVAGSENPRAFALPENVRLPSGVADEDFEHEELSVVGQGTRARYQVRRVVLSAGSGVAFTFDVFERRLRLKPSFEYFRQEVDLIGVVHRAVKLRRRTGFSTLEGFRLLALTRQEKQVQEGFGGGLELEVDTTRLGPFQTSVYGMGRVIRLEGGLDTTFTATNEFGETATWTFEPDRTLWRAGVGFRLRWLPE